MCYVADFTQNVQCAWYIPKHCVTLGLGFLRSAILGSAILGSALLRECLWVELTEAGVAPDIVVLWASLLANTAPESQK